MFNNPFAAPVPDPGPCSECQGDRVHLPGISAEAYVHYFRCPDCGSIEVMPKQEISAMEMFERR